MSTSQEAEAALHALELEPPVDTRQPIILSGNLYTDRALVLGVLSQDESVYVFNGRLVDLIFNGGEVLIQGLCKDILPAYLEKNISFSKIDGRTGRPKRCKAPSDIVKAIVAMVDYPGFRTLIGVQHVPFLGKDGVVVSERGYHRDSGVFLMLKERYDAVPEHPSQSDCVAALGCVLDVLEDFPFEQLEDKAAAVAMLLSAVCGPAVGHQVPLFAVIAHQPKSGKTLLSQIPSVLMGERPRLMAAAFKPDAFDKLLHATLRLSPPCVVFDNVGHTFGTEEMAAYLTSRTLDFRVLGTSNSETIEKRSMIIVNGNNLEVRADLKRRTLPIHLSDLSPMNASKAYRYPDLLHHVAKARRVLVPALLTILRGFFASDRDTQTGRWSSFDDWTDLVCGAVQYAGLPDPLGRRVDFESTIEANDRYLAQFLAHAPDAMLKAPGMKARDILHQAEVGNEDLAEAIEGLCDRMLEQISAGKLGKKLSHFKGQWCECLPGEYQRLVCEYDRRNGHRYFIEPMRG